MYTKLFLRKIHFQLSCFSFRIYYIPTGTLKHIVPFPFHDWRLILPSCYRTRPSDLNSRNLHSEQSYMNRKW